MSDPIDTCGRDLPGTERRLHGWRFPRTRIDCSTSALVPSWHGPRSVRSDVRLAATPYLPRLRRGYQLYPYRISACRRFLARLLLITMELEQLRYFQQVEIGRASCRERVCKYV